MSISAADLQKSKDAFALFLKEYGINGSDKKVMLWGDGSSVVNIDLGNTFYNSATLDSQGVMHLSVINPLTGSAVLNPSTSQPLNYQVDPKTIVWSQASSSASATPAAATSSSGSSLLSTLQGGASTVMSLYGVLAKNKQPGGNTSSKPSGGLSYSDTMKTGPGQNTAAGASGPQPTRTAADGTTPLYPSGTNFYGSNPSTPATGNVPGTGSGGQTAPAPQAPAPQPQDGWQIGTVQNIGGGTTTALKYSFGGATGDSFLVNLPSNYSLTPADIQKLQISNPIMNPEDGSLRYQVIVPTPSGTPAILYVSNSGTGASSVYTLGGAFRVGEGTPSFQMGPTSAVPSTFFPDLPAAAMPNFSQTPPIDPNSVLGKILSTPTNVPTPFGWTPAPQTVHLIDQNNNPYLGLANGQQMAYNIAHNTSIGAPGSDLFNAQKQVLADAAGTTINDSSITDKMVQDAIADGLAKQYAGASVDAIASDVVDPSYYSSAELDSIAQTNIVSHGQNALLANLYSKIAADKLSVTTAQNQFLNSEAMKFGGAMVGGAAAGYGLYASITSIFQTNVSFKGVLGAVASAVGLFTALHEAHKFLTDTLNKWTDGSQQAGVVIHNLADKLNSGFFHFLHLGSIMKFLTSTAGSLLIMAAVAAAAYIFGKKESNEEKAADTLTNDIIPTIWNSGGVMMLTALPSIFLGLSMSPSAPTIQSITVPMAQINTALSSAAGGQTIPTDTSRYSMAFVRNGSGGTPSEVIYLSYGGTDAKGNVIETVHAVTLAGNLNFTNPGSNAYINFFDPNSSLPNPNVLAALQAQNNLTTACAGLSPTDCEKVLGLAGGASHNATPVH